MSVNGYRVADSDMHVMEPPDLWQRYIAPEWRHAAPVGLNELHRDMRVRVKDHSLTRMGQVSHHTAPARGKFRTQASGPCTLKPTDGICRGEQRREPRGV